MENSADDLDIESRFFETLPYDSDDPDFNWYKTYPATDDEDEVMGNKKGHDKIGLKSDGGQKSRRYRKICQSTSHPRRVFMDEILPRRLESPASSELNCSEVITKSTIYQSPEKRLNQSLPSEAHCSLVRPSINERLSLNNYNATNTYQLDRPLTLHFQPDVMPTYRGFQLLGDSQLLRFSEQLLPYKNQIPVTNIGSSARRLGYCVSGQRIKEIEQRLKSKEYPIGEKVIMLIGTNDFLSSTPIGCMYFVYDSLVTYLKENVEFIILLTVPPVPKLAGNAEYWIKLKRFNNFILKHAEERKVFVFDLASLYISYNNTVSLEYFEENYFNNSARPDLIHLNKVGFQLLKSILDIYLEKNILV